MLSDDEQRFIKYWSENRDIQSSFKSKLLRGLPMAFLFCVPILLFIVCVYLFFPDWYMKVSATTPETFFVVIIAVFIAIIFYAFARMHFKWEMHEQQYLELLHRQKKSEAANNI